MADESETPPPSTPAVHPPTINHLLILTLTTSFAFIDLAPDLQDVLKIPSEQLWVSKGLVVWWTIRDGLLFGITYFGLVVVLREAIHRRSLQWMTFGHWYFFLEGPALLLKSLRVIAGRHLLGTDVDSLFENATGIAISLSLCLGWLWVAARLTPWIWRIAAVCLALMNLAFLLFYLQKTELFQGWLPHVPPMHFFNTSDTLQGCLLGTIALAYLSSALRKRWHYDWLHHLGLAVLALYSFNSVQKSGNGLLHWWWRMYTLFVDWFTAF